MELWIRVQNNKKLIQGLVKVDNLFVDTDIDKKWCIQNAGDTLGIYKTKKRTLEVLNNIEHWLVQTNENKQQVVVYKMPEE